MKGNQNIFSKVAASLLVTWIIYQNVNCSLTNNIENRYNYVLKKNSLWQIAINYLKISNDFNARSITFYLILRKKCLEEDLWKAVREVLAQIQKIN